MATIWRAFWSGTWWEYATDATRTVNVAAEDRSLTVTAESRTFTVDLEDRTVEVT